jgi:hypothetical protein
VYELLLLFSFYAINKPTGMCKTVRELSSARHINSKNRMHSPFNYLFLNGLAPGGCCES